MENYRVRGNTLPCGKLLIALENIITDKVTKHSAPKVKIDTSAPMEIGMAAGTRIRRRERKGICSVQGEGTEALEQRKG